MKYYAGLDVSLKEISICVVDQDGGPLPRRLCLPIPRVWQAGCENRSLSAGADRA